MSAHVSETLYFGDSLTDVGVLFGALADGLEAQILPGLIAALGPNPTPAEIAQAEQQAALLAVQQATQQLQARGFGPENAVTNEFTHAVYTGQVTGTTIINFANSGARVLGTQEPFGPGTGYDSNLGAQLDRFVASGTGDGSEAVLFIGSNDFSDILGDAADGNFFQLIGAATRAVGDLLDGIEDAARTLDDNGVETVYLGTLPPATFFPATDALDDNDVRVADIALTLYNSLLGRLASDLRSDGIDARIIDYSAVSEAITEDPSGFGILAERSDFLIDGSDFDSDQVAFWDPLHPAEAPHQAWGAYAAFVMAGGSTASLTDFGTINFQNNDDNAVFANGGNDTVLSFGGDDIVFGGTGSDRVYAGSGDDIVSGGRGDDRIYGNTDDDILAGGRGDDNIRGGWGDDVLIDGRGDDIVRGGLGDDVFIYVENTLEGATGSPEDTLKGGSGDDTLYLVLDDVTFDQFQVDGAGSVLSGLGISTSDIESIVAIDGRDAVEAALGGFDWFQQADFWGLVPAPSTDDLALA